MRRLTGAIACGRAFACLEQAWTPLPVRELLMRAARLDAGKGFCPKSVRDALCLHQMARPAVYLLLRRLPDGEFVAAEDIAHAGRLGRRIASGGRIMGRVAAAPALWG